MTMVSNNSIFKKFLFLLVTSLALVSQPNYGMEETWGKWVGRRTGSFVSDVATGAAQTFDPELIKNLEFKDFDPKKNIERAIKSIQKTWQGEVFKDFMRNNIRTVVYYGLLGTLGCSVALGTITLSYYGVSYGSRAFFNILEQYVLRRMKKPRVIIDSSKNESRTKRIMDYLFNRKPTFPKMIFAKEVEEQLEDITKQTLNINKKIKEGKRNATYRNLLLWGPPGTGKTMFARQLAHKSGLEWVEITGSSFFSEGAGIAAIDELFEWAQKSKKGLLIFVDEADSLLPDRTKLNVDGEKYNIVNHFLNYLGTKSNKFMLVACTNHKVVFDNAMRRRFHDPVMLPLPGMPERLQLLDLYCESILCNPKDNSKRFVESAKKELTKAKMEEIAALTKDYSSDEIATIIDTIKVIADARDKDIVTPEIIDTAVKRQIEGRQGFITTPPVDKKNG